MLMFEFDLILEGVLMCNNTIEQIQMDRRMITGHQREILTHSMVKRDIVNWVYLLLLI